ncbi:MAG: septum site-determining protein MinC [Chloroflexi bacterium]|nr:septum site-determining protein MinC [Chloroflexota bacterium]
MAQEPTRNQQGPVSLPLPERNEPRVQIKGTRKGLSITLGEGSWQEILYELDQRLSQGQAFFYDSQVNLQIGLRDMEQSDMEALMEMLARHRIELASLQTTSRASGETAQTLGIRLALPEVTLAPPEPRGPAEDWSEGVLLRRTLRSGQSIQETGHVVVIGDVNPGAEIFAGGDVIVWGKLRGMVHAGALGNSEAVVCALELRPTQLRIGTCIATSPAETASTGTRPEIAAVVNGQIVARPWSNRAGP